MLTPLQSTRCRRAIAQALAAVKPQFRLDWNDGIHGIAHWTRVWHHGKRLAVENDVDPTALALFAFLHDSQRRNDHFDPGHGVRAADFTYRLWRDGHLDMVGPRLIEPICEAMQLHSDGHTQANILVRCCWDADRLDLGRVGIRPNPDLLCTDQARQGGWIAHAVRLSQAMLPSEPVTIERPRN